MRNITGTWKAYYAAAEYPCPLNPDTDEFALLTIAGGKLTGKDTWGGIYTGTYKVVSETLYLLIDIDQTSEHGMLVFASLNYPLHLDIEGTYRNPNEIFLAGLANGSHPVSALCRRLTS